MPSMPNGDPRPSVDILIEAEAAIRGGGSAGEAVERVDPYWQDLVRLVQIFRHFSKGESREISKLRKKMASPVYDAYITKKEKPKRTVPRSGQPDLRFIDPSPNPEDDPEK